MVQAGGATGSVGSSEFSSKKSSHVQKFSSHTGGRLWDDWFAQQKGLPRLPALPPE